MRLGYVAILALATAAPASLGGCAATNPPVPIAGSAVSNPAAVHHNSWSVKKSIPTAVLCPGAAVVNGILYVVGGNTTITGLTDVVEAYDSAHDSWSEKAPLPIADAPALAVDGGLIYTIGGYSSGSGRIANVYRYNPGSAPDTGILDAYDASSKSWTSLADMPQAAVAPGAVTLNGLLYCFSGASSGNPYGATFYATTQAYTP